jgi:hypothetical protein
VLNKFDPTHVALAGNHVYVATDTAPASATNVDLILTDLGATGGSVSALAYGTRDNPNVVLAGRPRYRCIVSEHDGDADC